MDNNSILIKIYNIYNFFYIITRSDNGYEIDFTRTLTRFDKGKKSLPVPVPDKFTKKKSYPYPSYRIRYGSGKRLKGCHWHPYSCVCVFISVQINQTQIKLFNFPLKLLKETFLWEEIGDQVVKLSRLFVFVFVFSSNSNQTLKVFAKNIKKKNFCDKRLEIKLCLIFTRIFIIWILNSCNDPRRKYYLLSLYQNWFYRKKKIGIYCLKMKEKKEESELIIKCQLLVQSWDH